MLSVLLEIGPVKIYSFGIFLLLGVMLGMFVAWKKAQEYSIEDKVFFDIVLGTVFWGLVLGRVVYIGLHFSDFGFNVVRWLWVTHYVGISFWGALLGGVIGLWWWCKDAGVDLFKWLDLASLGLGMGLFWGKIGEFLNNNGRLAFVSLAEGLLCFGLFVWLWWLEHEYRTISWYRAGKNSAATGFMWFWLLIWFSLIRGIAGFINGENLWWIAIISLVVGIGGIYLRSGRSTKIFKVH